MSAFQGIPSQYSLTNFLCNTSSIQTYCLLPRSFARISSHHIYITISTVVSPAPTLGPGFVLVYRAAACPTPIARSTPSLRPGFLLESQTDIPVSLGLGPISLSPFRDLPDHQSCDFPLLCDRFPGPPASCLPTCLPTSAPIVSRQTAFLPVEWKEQMEYP